MNRKQRKFEVNGNGEMSDNEHSPFLDDLNARSTPNWIKVIGILQIVAAVCILVCSFCVLKHSEKRDIYLLLGIDFWSTGFIVIAGCFSITSHNGRHRSRTLKFALFFNAVCFVSLIVVVVLRGIVTRKYMVCFDTHVACDYSLYMAVISLLSIAFISIVLLLTSAITIYFTSALCYSGNSDQESQTSPVKVNKMRLAKVEEETVEDELITDQSKT